MWREGAWLPRHLPVTRLTVALLGTLGSGTGSRLEQVMLSLGSPGVSGQSATCFSKVTTTPCGSAFVFKGFHLFYYYYSKMKRIGRQGRDKWLRFYFGRRG